MFGGLGKLADMGNMLKQAQLVQERMKSAQADIEAHEVEGVSGGGMVKVRMKGTHQLLKIEIADSAFGATEKPTFASFLFQLLFSSSSIWKKKAEWLSSTHEKPFNESFVSITAIS